MNYRIIVTENGTEKIPISNSYGVPNESEVIVERVNEHIGNVANPHLTSLQQAIVVQGNVPAENGFKIGSTAEYENLLTILKEAIYLTVNGSVKHTELSVNGLFHTNVNGFTVDMYDGGIKLSNNQNTININLDGTITGLQDSVLAKSAVTKSYVDSLALGLKPHAPVKIMLEKGVDLYNFIAEGNGQGKTLTGTANGVFTYQGVYFAVGDRIGVMCYGYQRIDAGIYVITQLGDANNIWVLTRAEDFDGTSQFEVNQADVLFVQEGTHAKCMFIQTTKGTGENGSLVVDTDLVSWELFHKPQDYVFEQGLQIIGQNISVKPDITTRETILPVTVSNAGVGLQTSFVSDIAEAKKQEALDYADNLSIQNTQYVDEQIALVEQSIPQGEATYKKSVTPQFHLLNGQTLQNVSGYLYLDNSNPSGNDGGMQSNNVIPFLMPFDGFIESITVRIGSIAVGGLYVEGEVVNLNFGIFRQLEIGAAQVYQIAFGFVGTIQNIGSYGNFAANSVDTVGVTGTLNVQLLKGRMYGVKFLSTPNNSNIASAIRGCIVGVNVRES